MIKNDERGISLFVAVIVMSILLFISFAAVNISIKGNLFATSGRDSQYAFYAADAGIECAVYWDSKSDKFATSTPGSPISCVGLNIAGDGSVGSDSISGTSTITRIGGGGNANPTSVFGFTLNQGSNPVSSCAIVTVTKNTNGTTYVKSRGYNTCDTSNPRRLERGIEMTY
jgi:hypothetical protein